MSEDLRVRLIGENEDDERMDSGDDEEIESDDAFDESDEEKYGFYFPSNDHDEEEDAVSTSEDAPEALEELQDFISTLDSTDDKKRKSNDVSTQSASKKRRLMQERTEAGDEGEFGVSVRGESQPNVPMRLSVKHDAHMQALQHLS